MKVCVLIVILPVLLLGTQGFWGDYKKRTCLEMNKGYSYEGLGAALRAASQTVH